MRVHMTDAFKSALIDIRSQLYKDESTMTSGAYALAEALYKLKRGTFDSVYLNDKVPSFLDFDKSNSKLVSYLDVDRDCMRNSVSWDDFLETNLDCDLRNGFSHKKRTSTKVARLVRKIFTQSYLDDKQIKDIAFEQFSNTFNSLFNKEGEDFEVQSGDGIYAAYHCDNYNEDYVDCGSLWGSCMRYDEKNHYMEFYARNTDVCQILVLRKAGGIVGRALLWKFVDVITGENCKLMDRIYTARDFDVYKFKNWAKDNGFIYKLEQSFDCDTFVLEDGEKSHLTYHIPIKQYDYYRYPYCDTFYFYSSENRTLSNRDEEREDDTLRDENGCTDLRQFRLGAEEDNDETLIYTRSPDAVFLDWYGGWAYDDDTLYCEHTDSVFLKNDIVFSDYHKCDIPLPQSVLSKRYETRIMEADARYIRESSDYIAREDSVYSAYKDSYYHKEDAKYSDIEKDFLALDDDDITYSKYHKENIFERNARYYKGDAIHIKHCVFSHYEKMFLPKDYSAYILGVGWVLKENEQLARDNKLELPADMVTEYEELTQNN